MASFVLNTVISKLPALVEKFEPELEKGLRTGLKKLKTEHPDQAAGFLSNWSKLNTAVQQELAVASPGATAPSLAPAPEGQNAAARRSKRTKRRRHHRK